MTLPLANSFDPGVVPRLYIAPEELEPDSREGVVCEEDGVRVGVVDFLPRDLGPVLWSELREVFLEEFLVFSVLLSSSP